MYHDISAPYGILLAASFFLFSFKKIGRFVLVAVEGVRYREVLANRIIAIVMALPPPSPTVLVPTNKTDHTQFGTDRTANLTTIENPEKDSFLFIESVYGYRKAVS